MPLIKKRDVKSYFAARRRAHSHPPMPASQPDAAANSGPASGAVPSIPSAFAKDFREEHSFPRKSVKPAAGNDRGTL
jgi:hypothetical protein